MQSMVRRPPNVSANLDTAENVHEREMFALCDKTYKNEMSELTFS